MPSIEKVEVVKKGQKGVRRAKLYYIRTKSKREIEKIYSRTTKKEVVKKKKVNKRKVKKATTKKPTRRKASKKSVAKKK